ncbi:MAG: hypothetical protein ACKOBM_13120 [Gammaproteobacteria bacterium]
MSVITTVGQKVGQVGRDLVEINAETVRKLAELSADNLRRYIDLNKDYFEKLPSVRAVGAYVDLQRTYNTGLWNSFRDDLRARGDILRSAAERTGTVVRGAFAGSEGAASSEA